MPSIDRRDAVFRSGPVVIWYRYHGRGAAMRAHPVAGILAAMACLLCEASVGQDRASVLGLFEGQSDIGSVVPPGTGSYVAGKETYALSSAGANTWYRVDDFHYLWKKAVGDLAFTADITFPP